MFKIPLFGLSSVFYTSCTKKEPYLFIGKTHKFKNLLNLMTLALKLLSADPFYPSLQTHEIEPLSRRYGMKVWQSYLENKTSGAMRMYWVYGPDQKDITIIGLEPHPEDKKNGAYDRISLSDL